MSKLVLILSGLFLLASCGKNGDSIENPPKRFQGAWAFSSSEAAANATEIKVTNPAVLPDDPCQGVSEADTAVDAGVIRIDNNGTVLSAKKVTSVNSAYISIGKIKQDGLFLPEPGTEKEYIKGFGKLASSSVAVKPLIYFVVNKETSNVLSMDIKVVTNSAAGFFISDVVETRQFAKINIAQEKQAIVDALTCLDKASSN